MGIKFVVCLLNPIITIKQTLRTIVTYDCSALEVSFANGWQLRENFSTNLGIILLIFNCIIFNSISLFLEIKSSEIEEKAKKLCLNSLSR